MTLTEPISRIRESGYDRDVVEAFLKQLESGELISLPTDVVIQTDRLSEILKELSRAVEEFEHVGTAENHNREELLRAARTRFSIHIAALVEAEAEHVNDLTTSLNTFQGGLKELAQGVAGLVERTITDSAMRKELELAGYVQTMLVPPPDGLRVSALRTFAWYEPADQCSGDWWSAVPLGEGDVFITLGDVTGHGAAAALVAGIVKGACDISRLGMGKNLRPMQLLSMLNRVLSDSVRGEFLMTFVGARFYAEKSVMSIANAGHRSVWHCRDAKVRAIGGKGEPPLGSRPVQRYEEQLLQLQPGDQLYFFTDGIPECENEEGRQFGERRMKELVESHSGRGPESVRDALKDAVALHLGEGRSDDDLTFVCIEVIRP